jgi:hypothetical protein
LRASALLVAILSVVHVGALTIVLSVPLPVSVQAALAVLIVASFYRELNRHALRRARSAVVAFELRAEDGTCALQRRRSPNWEEGRVVDQWVYPRLTLLVLRLAQRKWPVSVVIPQDAVETDSFRRLRVQLRLRSAAE